MLRTLRRMLFRGEAEPTHDYKTINRINEKSVSLFSYFKEHGVSIDYNNTSQIVFTLGDVQIRLLSLYQGLNEPPKFLFFFRQGEEFVLVRSVLNIAIEFAKLDVHFKRVRDGQIRIGDFFFDAVNVPFGNVLISAIQISV